MLEYLLIEAKRLGEIYQKDYSNFNRIAYKGTCLSAVLTGVAFLEATTNEIFRDYTDGVSNAVSDNFSAEKLRVHFERGAKRRVIEKFTQILELAGVSTWDKGKGLIQDASLVVQLRNALVHYTPEDNTLISFEPEKISSPRFFKELKTKIKTDSFGKTIGGFFPDGCLCLGLVEWVYQTVIDFENDFYKRLQVEPHYKHVLGEIISK